MVLIHGDMVIYIPGLGKVLTILENQYNTGLSYFGSGSRISLFHMCFGIRILSPFHLANQIISIQNLNCPKNAKYAYMNRIFQQSSMNVEGVEQTHTFFIHIIYIAYTEDTKTRHGFCRGARKKLPSNFHSFP